MKAIEIVASVAEQSHGPSYSVPRLAEGLAGAGAEVELHTVGAPGDVVRDGVRRRVFAHDLGGLPRIGHLRLSAEMRRALEAEARGAADVLHTHGMWLAPNIYPADAARAAGKAFVISPRGMLGDAAMKFSGLQKRLFWMAFQKKAMAGTAFIHATGEGERDEVRAMGLTNPVAIIPNGIDMPPPAKRASGGRVVLSLGRVHPKKGLDRLVRAWGLIGRATDGWRLRIAGPSELGYADELEGLAHSMGLKNVDIEGPLYGDDKLAAYREASLFVLPSLNENFAMTVAEALAAGTPVISTKGAPWAGLDREGCGWWIDHGEAELGACLTGALARPLEELAAMGEKGRLWMERDFSWDHIGRRMLAAYEWAVRGGEPPREIDL